MGIDRLYWSGKIKLISALVFLVYFCIFNSGLRNSLPNNFMSDMLLKVKISSNSCLVLLGGSNVEMGISANVLTKNGCKSINLGLFSEAGGFEGYLKWLGNRVGAKFVIYSTADMWNDSGLFKLREPDLNFISLPSVSLISQLKAIFGIRKKIEFDAVGDFRNYSCSPDFHPIKINERNFNAYNDLVVNEIWRRLNILKKNTSATKIFVRIPPVYALRKDADIYNKIMRDRIKILQSLGAVVIGETAVSVDDSLFCDNFHPNEKGREFFSNEIRNSLAHLLE